MKQMLLLLGLVSACSADSVEVQRVELAPLTFDVPADWVRHDTDRRGMTTAEWKPEDNERKEAITVIRTELSPALATAGSPSLLSAHLARAQRSLDRVRASSVVQVTTPKGLVGARIELDFVPPGKKETYHRIHVVLADGAGALVHVLYTARSPNSRALDLVIDSIRKEEA